MFNNLSASYAIVGIILHAFLAVAAIAFGIYANRVMRTFKDKPKRRLFRFGTTYLFLTGVAFLIQIALEYTLFSSTLVGWWISLPLGLLLLFGIGDTGYAFIITGACEIAMCVAISKNRDSKSHTIFRIIAVATFLYGILELLLILNGYDY